MSNGTVRGNDGATTGRNIAVGAGASLSNAGTAQHGTINAAGVFASLGTLSTTNSTIRLVNGIGQPTGVTVAPAVVSVPRGGTRSFRATVTGIAVPQTVTWSIVESGVHAQTTIIDGVLSIAVEESLETFTVRATSTFNESVLYWDTSVTVLQEGLVLGTTLAEQLAWLRGNASRDGLYFVEINANEVITPTTANTGANQALPTGRTNLTIIFHGVGAMRTVTLSANGSHFWIPYGVTLILDENVTLQGRNNNTSHLVRVASGGTLRMNMGSRITGNQNVSGGGGVHINNGGVFVLDGGEISGNSTTGTGVADDGGGVHVESGGRFDMLSGTISGNAGQWGGGVHVSSNDTFRMSGGVIYGNETTVPMERRNTRRHSTTMWFSGASLSNMGGAANRGTFNAAGTFTSLAPLSRTDNTIRVVNGNLQ